VIAMIIYDSFLLHLPLATIPANSSSSRFQAPTTFILGARNFHSRRTWYEKPAPERGVDLWPCFWNACHGYALRDI